MNSIYTLVSWFGLLPGGGGGGGSDPGTTSSTGTTDCPHKITNVLTCTSGNGGSIWNLLDAVVNFLAIGVGVVVLVGIVFGAFEYASAGGSAEQAKKGIGHIRNAVIALLLFTFMWAIINFIIPGGLF